MTNQIKAVIFDCDGVLIDSEEAHYLAWLEAFGNQDLTFSRDEYRAFVGHDTRAAAQKAGFEWKCDPEKLLRDKNSKYDLLKKEGVASIVSTLDFVLRLAKEKEKLGLKLGVASGSRREDIFCHLNHHQIEKVFDVVLSGFHDLGEYNDPEGTNKPKPYIYLKAAKMLNVLPEECVAIEDSHTGVTSAKAAGFFTVAVPNLFTDQQDLSKADLKIDSFSGITVEEFFNRITKRKDETWIKNASPWIRDVEIARGGMC